MIETDKQRVAAAMRQFTRRLWPLVLLGLSACLGTLNGPVIEEFSADPPTLVAGSDSEVVLSWRLKNASDARLALQAVPASGTGPTTLSEDLGGQDRFVTRPPETMTYRLIASGPSGTTSKELTVQVVDGEVPPGAPVIDSFRSSKSYAQPGEQITLSWSVADAEKVTLGSSTGLSEQVPSTSQRNVTINERTTFSLTAINSAGSVSRSVTVHPLGEPAEKILVLIAGQSNAAGQGLPFPAGKEEADPGVWMLAHGVPESEWRWVPAAEPTHKDHQHSFGVRLGNELRRATGKEVYLVPAAVGGSGISNWIPGSSQGYFENAAARATFASNDLQVPVSLVAWFQGETDSGNSGLRNEFVNRTETVFEAFRNELPGSPPIIFAQLAKRLQDPADPGRNLGYQVIREKQRMMAAGAVESNVVGPGQAPGVSTDDKPYYQMVVTHDVGMSDVRHVGREGQKIVGERFAHAFLVHFWPGNGARSGDRAGPRLVAVVRESANTIRVKTSREVQVGADAQPYFTVFAGDTEMTVSSVVRDPADADSVLIQVSGTLPSNPAEIIVRYMPGDDVGEYTSTMDGIYASDASGMRLPLPAFGDSPSFLIPSSYRMSY